MSEGVRVVYRYLESYDVLFPNPHLGWMLTEFSRCENLIIYFM